MIEVPEFCPYPEDIEGCGRALIQSWKEKKLAQDCMIKGLQLNCDRCKGILSVGLYPNGAKHSFRLPDSLCGDKEFREAIEDVVVFGYQSSISVVQEAFVQAYKKLVWHIIIEKGLASALYAEDIYQETFLGLHRCISNPCWVRRTSLTSFVACSAANACNKAIRRNSREQEEITDEVELPPARPWISPEKVERWEAFDARLVGSRREHLIIRVILASRFLEWQETSKNYPVGQMMADWRALAGMSDTQLSLLLDPIVVEARHLTSGSAVSLVAEQLNREAISPRQVAVAMSAAEGHSLSETRRFLIELMKLTPEAIHTRFCRACREFRPRQGGIES